MEDFLIDLVNLHLAYVKDTHEDVEGALVIHVRDFLAVHGLWEALPE